MGGQSTSGAVHDFIGEQRGRFHTEKNNQMAIAFNEVIRYYEFLQVILRRYSKANRAYIENVGQLMQESKKQSSHEPSAKEQKALDRMLRSTAVSQHMLHLEIESFYLFSRIVLDKIAQALVVYFGKGESESVSHSKMLRGFPIYARAKKLSSIPTSLIEKIDRFQKDLVDFRDHVIVHQKSPRVIRGAGYGPEKQTYMSYTRLYPKEGDPDIKGLPPTKLMQMLDEYIVEILAYVRGNEDKADT